MGKVVTLKPGKYNAPEGYTIKVRAGIITISPRKRVHKEKCDAPLCKDCAFFSIGRTRVKSVYDSTICLKKRKIGYNFYNLKPLHYSVTRYAHACENFISKFNFIKEEQNE